MGFNRFSLGIQFTWMKATYEVVQYLPNSRLEVENLSTGECKTVAITELAEALFKNELSFHETVKSNVQLPKITLDDYSPKQQAAAYFRYEVIKPLLTILNQARADVHARVKEVKKRQKSGDLPPYPVGISSIYRWLKAYKENNQDIRALVPRTRKKQEVDSRLHPTTEKILQNVINQKYYRRETGTIKSVQVEVARQLEIENLNRTSEGKTPLEVPSESTVWRRIGERDLKGRLIAKRGSKKAKEEMTQYGRMEKPTMPLQRVEIDHTITDVMVIDEKDNLPIGRLTLTYCIDVATRYPLGFYLGFEPPSYFTVAQCLYHAILPKTDVKEKYDTENEWLAHGIPHRLIIDNGREFLGKDLEDACLSLGIVLQQTPVRTPHFKGTIERHFGTINSLLLHTLPGTTFSNIASRKDYDSLKMAVVNLDELTQIMNIMIVDEYTQSFHKGLGGVPAQAWEIAYQKGFYPRMPSNPEELPILLGKTETRTLHHYGIELNHLIYNDSNLGELRARLKQKGLKKVKVKLLPDDLSTVYVFDPFGQTYIPVQAIAQEYVKGLSLWKHNIICQYARNHIGEVNLANLGKARKKIQEIVDNARQNKKSRSRKKKARWEQSSSSPTPEASSEDAFSEFIDNLDIDDLGSDDDDSDDWGIIKPL